MKYNFKYFKSTDKGVIKRIERSKLLFKVNPSTKYVLEKKQNITYQKDYLNGPFPPEQNMIEIIDEEKTIINESKNKNNNLNQKSKLHNNLVINNYNIKNEVEEQVQKPNRRTIKNNTNIEDDNDFITIKKISATGKKK